MRSNYLPLAAFLGAISVALGAFAAHKLKLMAAESTVVLFETGVRYMFYHVFALLAVGLLQQQRPSRLLNSSGILFLLGILLFSGSLFGMVAKQVFHWQGFSWLGPITPIGGVCFIAGWICLGLSVKKQN